MPKKSDEFKTLKTDMMKPVKITLIVCLFILTGGLSTVSAQFSSINSDIEAVKKVADNILKNTTYEFKVVDENKLYKTVNVKEKKGNIRASHYTEWRYWNGVINLAMLQLANTLNDKKYQELAVKNYAFVFDNLSLFKDLVGTEDRQYPFYNLYKTRYLDDCGAMGAGLIEVNRFAPRKEYVTYFDSVAYFINNKVNRLSDGTFARLEPFDKTVWADDLYMSLVFLSHYGKWTADIRYFDDAILQVENMTKYLYNKETGLYYHCYYDDIKQNGVAHWGRCNGWVMMAQAELLDNLPKDFLRRDMLVRTLEQQIRGVSRYQDISGMWHQLINKNDSYLETSSTAMFTYSIAKSVNNGSIDKRYISIALQAWEGLKQQIRDDGQVQNICIGTGIEDDLVFYYKRPSPLNNELGLGAFLLAGSEIIKYKRMHPDIAQ